MKKINKFFEHGDKNPEYLVILLHGYGSNGEDLIALAPELSETINKPYFISPNAPMELLPHLPAYQWFELENRDPQIMYPQIIQANNLLDEFIANQLKRFNLTHDKLIIIGFSQGAMMSLYNSTRSKKKAAGVVALSGRFISPEDLGEKVNSKPQTCLIHGQDDEVVPIENFFKATQDLGNLGFNFEFHEIEDLGHSINISVLKKIKEFLKKITS